MYEDDGGNQAINDLGEYPGGGDAEDFDDSDALYDSWKDRQVENFLDGRYAFHAEIDDIAANCD